VVLIIVVTLAEENLGDFWREFLSGRGESRIFFFQARGDTVICIGRK
jgi:hypothetical protein